MIECQLFLVWYVVEKTFTYIIIIIIIIGTKGL